MNNEHFIPTFAVGISISVSVLVWCFFFPSVPHISGKETSLHVSLLDDNTSLVFLSSSL